MSRRSGTSSWNRNNHSAREPMLQWVYSSPYGLVRLFAEDGKLCRVLLGGSGAGAGRRENPDWWAPLVRALDRYFQGNGLPCNPAVLWLGALSDFQRLVYDELVKVEFGRLVSYGELASLCGRPGSARAVGAAMGANPMPLFIPCHRVVQADAGLGGFGAGVQWKERLLRHEGWTVRAGRIMHAAGANST